jgi:hypothetical protein
LDDNSTDVPSPTAILLPADSQIPLRREEGATTGTEDYEWQRPYESRFLELRTDRDRAAWLHFCHGHHVEFLYWQTTRLAGEQAVAALRAGDEPELERWLDRAAALIRGSGAMLYFCGALDAETYDRCLRPSMESERDDFSGTMSRDFVAMMHAKADLIEALAAADRRDLIHRFHAAERIWFAHHSDVIHALHPGKSLLQEKARRLADEVADFDYREYVRNVVHSEQALSDYDDYFGVTRSDDMTLDAYWIQALEKLALAHSRFAMDASTREELMVGDASLLGIVSELLEAEPATSSTRSAMSQRVAR